MRKNIIIHINNALDRNYQLDKVDPVLSKIFEQAGYVTDWGPLDWNESFRTDTPYHLSARHFCSFVFESLTLLASGSMLKCCMDLKG